MSGCKQSKSLHFCFWDGKGTTIFLICKRKSRLFSGSSYQGLLQRIISGDCFREVTSREYFQRYVSRVCFQGMFSGDVFRETVPGFRLLPLRGPVRVNVAGIPEPFPLIMVSSRIQIHGTFRHRPKKDSVECKLLVERILHKYALS